MKADGGSNPIPTNQEVIREAIVSAFCELPGDTVELIDNGVVISRIVAAAYDGDGEIIPLDQFQDKDHYRVACPVALVFEKSEFVLDIVRLAIDRVERNINSLVNMEWEIYPASCERREWLKALYEQRAIRETVGVPRFETADDPPIPRQGNAHFHDDGVV